MPEQRTDAEMVRTLRRCNPFGGYRLPKNDRERQILRETLDRYERRDRYHDAAVEPHIDNEGHEVSR